MIIHIREDHFRFQSGPVCGAQLAADDQIIGPRIAYWLVEAGESPLLKLKECDLCPNCLSRVECDFYEWSALDYLERKEYGEIDGN